MFHIRCIIINILYYVIMALKLNGCIICYGLSLVSISINIPESLHMVQLSVYVTHISYNLVPILHQIISLIIQHSFLKSHKLIFNILHTIFILSLFIFYIEFVIFWIANVFFQGIICFIKLRP